MKILIVGGDRRQIILSMLLKDDGHEVTTFALGQQSDLKNIPADAQYVILPLPTVAKDGYLNAPLYDKKISMDELLETIAKNATVFGANLSDDFISKSGSRQVYDYYAREDIQLINADLTAQGAVGILINDREVALSGENVLITGYGRIAKCLARKLNGMNCKITIAARSRISQVQAKIDGYEALDIYNMRDKIGLFDVIVNTVPTIIFGENEVADISNDCYCLDLASNPGGFNMAACEKFKVVLHKASSLPGKCAPVSAAMAIKDTIYNILEGK